jgi:peptidoglycan/xylan/chitin deacetylase (PgdA/CDA1 family)
VRDERAVILVYHRVSPENDPFYPPTHPDLLRDQLVLLKRIYEIVPLEELVDRLKNKRSLRGLCAVTFDDGYRDFADFAYPVLAQLQVPVTHFITVEGVVEGRPSWSYRLNRALHYVKLNESLEPKPRADVPGLGELGDEARRIGALTVEARQDLIDQLERLFAVPPDPPMLRAADIGALSRSIVSWGSHTVTHAILSRCDAPRLTFELAQSRAVLEEITGGPIRYLAYPNGGFDARVIAAAAECGYEASFIAYRRRVTGTTPLHEIPRFDIGRLPTDMVSLDLSGITPFLRGLVRSQRPA